MALSNGSMQRAHVRFFAASTDTIELHAVHIHENSNRNAVKKAERANMTHNSLNGSRRHSTSISSAGSVDRRIRAFLDGDSHGEDVLDALYGAIADEPIPQRLTNILKR